MDADNLKFWRQTLESNWFTTSPLDLLPSHFCLSNGRRIIIIHIASRLYNFYRKATY